MLLVWIVLLTLLLPAPAPAATYYVATTGSDSNAGTMSSPSRLQLPIFVGSAKRPPTLVVCWPTLLVSVVEPLFVIGIVTMFVAAGPFL